MYLVVYVCKVSYSYVFTYQYITSYLFAKLAAGVAFLACIVLLRTYQYITSYLFAKPAAGVPFLASPWQSDTRVSSKFVSYTNCSRSGDGCRKPSPKPKLDGRAGDERWER